MAHTRQTARKTTGGMTPAQQLKIKKAMENASAQQNKPLRRKRQERAKARKTRSTGGLAPRLDLLTPAGEDEPMVLTPIGSLLSPTPDTPSTQAEVADLKVRYNQFCMLCQDGGEMPYRCNTCRRVVCNACLILPSGDLPGFNNLTLKFVCPSCHELEDRATVDGHKGKRAFRPYEGFTVLRDGQEVTALSAPLNFSNNCGASARRQMNDDPLFIIHLCGPDMHSEGSLPSILAAYLHTYFSNPDSLQLKVIDFDLGSKSKIDLHTKAMESLANNLCSQPEARILIFVSTHSDQDRGDLFAGVTGKGVQVSAEVSQFFDALIPPSARAMTQGATLVLLTCGWTFSYTESRSALKRSLQSLGLQNAIAFTAVRFQAVLATLFLNALFVSHFIQGFGLREAIPKALLNSFDLGSHTDFVLFDHSPSHNPITMSATKYIWWNSHYRPYGFTLPFLCPVCRAVRPWKELTQTSDGWVTSCENPLCGLRSDGSRESPAAKMEGIKPKEIEFVTPSKKRTNGWFSQDITSSDFV